MARRDPTFTDIDVIRIYCNNLSRVERFRVGLFFMVIVGDLLQAELQDALAGGELDFVIGPVPRNPLGLALKLNNALRRFLLAFGRRRVLEFYSPKDIPKIQECLKRLERLSMVRGVFIKK